MTVKFFSAWFCPYAQRAWIALEHHQIPYEYVESLTVNKNQDEGNHGYEKNARLLELNPKGLVPTLEFPHSMIANSKVNKDKLTVVNDALVMTESIDCIEFLNSMADKKGEQDLIPDLTLLSDAKTYNQRVCSTFYHVLMKPTKEEQKEAFGVFVRNVAEYMNDVQDDGFYKCSSPTIVDFTVIPYLLRIILIKHYRPTFDFLEFTSEACLEKLNSYVERMKSVPAVQKTLWEDEKSLIEVYRRYADGTATSQVGQAVRSGKNAHDV